MKTPFAMALVLASCSVAAEMETATPESQGVASTAIAGWIDACEREFDAVGGRGALHGFVLVRHGKVIAEGSWKPFDTLNRTHMLYSHSKSFTSTAIGLLFDEGKLDLDERIVDVFAECVPTNANGNVRQLRVRDLLTMNVGASNDHMLGRGDNENWQREFFRTKNFECAPGTRFRYDSDATYMLAAIVERKSGRKMMDFLKERLFDPLGITQAWTTFSPEGIPCGGWGMNMTTRELARFGQLYLQRGVWNGKRVLSSEWVTLASARETWSGWQNVGVKALGDGSDWEQGYGFQFWRCHHGAYRADGACGQYTIVMPDEDAVLSIHAGLPEMQKELDLVWDHLLPAMKPRPLPEDAAAQKQLAERISALSLKPFGGVDESRAGAWAGQYELKENSRGFKSVSFSVPKDGRLECRLVTRCGEQAIPAGADKWLSGKMRIDPESYEALGGYIGEHSTAASYGVDGKGNFRLRVYLTGDTGFLDFTIDARRRLNGDFWAMGGCQLEGK